MFFETFSMKGEQRIHGIQCTLYFKLPFERGVYVLMSYKSRDFVRKKAVSQPSGFVLILSYVAYE